MRRALISALTLALVWLAVPATPALAAAQAKVVVVVGPAGGLTAHYKADADAIAAEARRYTSDVVRIYTPNATWARVKAAAQGANVLVYLGHGNGWPSIYGPFQTVTKDGLGLDPGSGANSTRTVYYGEDFIRKDILLAPNAVVLLYHLCYASGNTEPGLAVGTFSEARQRVDNYGAGFIGAGARAVFAEGHPAHPRHLPHPPAVHDQPDDGVALPRWPDGARQRARPVRIAADAGPPVPDGPRHCRAIGLLPLAHRGWGTHRVRGGRLEARPDRFPSRRAGPAGRRGGGGSRWRCPVRDCRCRRQGRQAIRDPGGRHPPAPDRRGTPRPTARGSSPSASSVARPRGSSAPRRWLPATAPPSMPGRWTRAVPGSRPTATT